jgi:predicted metal-binding membrane protein
VENIATNVPEPAASTEVAESGLRMLARANPVGVAAVLLGAALVTWIVTIGQMGGMDMGPGTDLGSLGWYVGVWVTMMAAMMLPSVAPMVLVFSRVARDRARRGRAYVPTWVFVAGYLAAWTGYGLVAYGVYRVAVAADPGFLAWDEQGPYVAGGAIVLAGLYQLTPLKAKCLKHCRTPLHFILHDWREGAVGALRMGVEHGAYCVGCCWGLMLILFALGVMSLVWMAVVAGVIFAEKTLPFGWRLTRPLAVVFVALGIWVMAAPSSVPGLTEPAGGGMQMQMQMDTEMNDASYGGSAEHEFSSEAADVHIRA